MLGSVLQIRSDPPEKHTPQPNPSPAPDLSESVLRGPLAQPISPGSPPTYQRFAHSNLRSRTQAAMPSIVPGTSPQPGIGFAWSSIGCKDCVAECRQPVFSAVELTAQCTDQCVVIACHDLTHDEMPCFGTGADQHCDLECDGVTDCTDCTGYEDLLQCCTDYHSYSSQPRPSTESASPTLPWDYSLDSLLCGCTEQSLAENRLFDAGNSGNLSNNDGADTILSSPRSATVSSHFSPAMSASGTPFLSSLFVPSETTPSHPQPVTASCMWGDCHEFFSNLSELAAHVNCQHLSSLPPPSFPNGSPKGISSEIQLQPHDNLPPSDLSCRWADCNLYPSQNSVPDPSSESQRDDALGILAHHLLQDHLGFLANLPLLDCPDKTAVNASDEPLVSESIPTPPISPPPSSEVQTTVKHQCSGTHICHWEYCSRVFSSCDELTTHITSLHVGAGKAHYVCLWKDCDRRGDRGFSSKQKICRHLQSHTGHRPFQCEECKQYFSEAATLQQHMRRHTQEKPYICDFPGCGKAFAITGALTIHKRKHNGHKPFKCKYCDRAFAESSNLSKHLRTHTGDRPYLCKKENCGKSFARPDQLTRHMGMHQRKSGQRGR